MRLLVLTVMFWLFFVNAAFGDVIFPGDGPRRRRPWPDLPPPVDQPVVPPTPAPAPTVPDEEPWHPNLEDDDSDESLGFAVVSGLALVALAGFALSRDHRPRRRSRPLHV